jgi:hypothetical protein
MSVIEELWHGSIDIHVHAGPDPRVERRVDALEASRQAEKAGMRAIVLKSHEYPTAPVAQVVSQLVTGVTVFGSICLDFEVGGLNVYALEASARLGAKIVWMPTFTSANDMKINKRGDPGTGILDSTGKILPVVNEILGIVRDHGMVLATGHISRDETFALVEKATQSGVSMIVVTHPLWPRGGAKLSLTEQQQLAKKGAFIEHCFGNTMPFPDRLDPMKIVEAVKAVGAEHCIMSTDLGQAHNPAPAEGMRMAIGTMLQCGLDARDVEFLVKANPSALLGLG